MAILHSTMDAGGRPVLRQYSSTGSIRDQLMDGSANGSPSPAPRGRITKSNNLNSPQPSSRSRSSDRFTRASSAAPSRNGFRAANVRRWDGNQRTTVTWDGLRRVSWEEKLLLVGPGLRADRGCVDRTPSFGFRLAIASSTSMNEGSPEEGHPCDCRSPRLNRAIAGRFCSGPPYIQFPKHRHQLLPMVRIPPCSLCNKFTTSFTFQRLHILAGRKLSCII